jgi:ABC-type bacteriocin/lantibiotic exporter with double-glycine peptidase domain
VKIELLCLKQEQDYTCVPACIRIVLRHLGSDFSEAEIGVACKTTERGTDQNEAAEGLATLGFNTISLEGVAFEDMNRFVSRGLPVIVFLSIQHLPYGGQVGTHAVVVNGFEDDYVSFVDPARGEEIEINKNTFLGAWDERGRIGLVIESKSDSPAKMMGTA